MKRKSLLMLLTASLLLPLLGAFPLSAAAEDPYYHGEKTLTTLWSARSDEGKYPNHRIPGIVVTKKDTVIVYCEARTGDTSHSLKNAGDWCLMDIYIQRSEDGGKTFSDPIYIAKGDDLRACVNNPVMIVGNDNTLHILYCKNYSVLGGGLWYRKSTDDGKTWSEEVNVSKFASSVPHDAFAFGPTHGLCTRDGVLISPVWLVPAGGGRDGKLTDHGPSQGYVFYSKDNGETWQLSGRTAQNVGEMCIAELSNGHVILNSRATGYRKVTTSPNGISNWTTTYVDEQLPDPSCCGGMVQVDLPGLPYAHLFVNCASPVAEDRTKVTLRCSFDDCVTWEKSVLLAEYEGGYCDVAVDSKGKIYVLYEVSFGKQVRMVTMSFVDTFINGDPLKTASVTEFDLSKETALNYIQSSNHLEATAADGALRLTTTDTRKHSVLLSFASETKNLNLTRTSAAVLRMRVTTEAGGEMQLGVYTATGRQKPTEDGGYTRIPVSADGEWQDVVVDFTSFGAAGRLNGLRLEMFSDSLRGAVGDTMEIASVKFYEDADKAYAALGKENPNRPQDSTEEGTQAEPSATAPVDPPKEKGCRSVASALSSLAAVFMALPFLKRKHKK